MVARVPERPRREPPRRRCGSLEVCGRQVVAHQPQVQVRQVAQPRVQVLLGRLFGVGDRVEGPVVLVQRRSRPPLGHHHIVAGPFCEAPLRARRQQPVGCHREHSVLQSRRAPRGADCREEPAEAQPPPHCLDRGDGPDSGRPLSAQRADVDALFVQVRLQRGHDPLELARLAQSRHLPQTQQGPVTHLGAVAHGLHQRQVLVGLVAPAATGRLHEHTHNNTINIPSRPPYVAPTNPRRNVTPQHKTPRQRPPPITNTPSTRQTRDREMPARWVGIRPTPVV